jgi:hypothetical protein
MCTIVCEQHPMGQKNEFPYTHQLSKQPGDILQDPICTIHKQMKCSSLTPLLNFFLCPRRTDLQSGHTLRSHVILLYKHEYPSDIGLGPLLLPSQSPASWFTSDALAHNTFLWLRAAKIKAMIAAAGVGFPHPPRHVHARGQFNDSLMCNFYPIR